MGSIGLARSDAVEKGGEFLEFFRVLAGEVLGFRWIFGEIVELRLRAVAGTDGFEIRRAFVRPDEFPIAAAQGEAGNAFLRDGVQVAEVAQEAVKRSPPAAG
jgi:hypothetical protein